MGSEKPDTEASAAAGKRAKREGPSVTVELSCFDCRYVETERYQVQGDSGCDVYCIYGDAKRHIADSRFQTPDWCPKMGKAAKRALMRVLDKMEGD